MKLIVPGFAIMFCIFWIYMAIRAGAPWFFVLFGIAFLVLLIFTIVRNHSGKSSNSSDFSDESDDDFGEDMEDDTEENFDENEHESWEDVQEHPDSTASGEKRYCPSCGAEVAPGNRFCENCGQKLK